MVPAAVVEELPSARAQEGEDVLEVRGGARRRAKRGRIERASARGEKHEARESAADLEATRVDVLVRQAVAREVEERPEEERREPLTAPAAAPVATWSATITLPFLADACRARSSRAGVRELAFCLVITILAARPEF
jgi:hypothetical protein